MKALLLFLHLLTTGALAWAHGEDKPGPHGGQIQMPGNFHVEAVQRKDGFEFYLLDMEFKNPTVTNSTLTATWESKGQKQELKCVPKKSSFLCDLPKAGPLSGQVAVKAKRNLDVGSMEAIFAIGKKTQVKAPSGHHH